MNYAEAVEYIDEIPKFTKKNSLDHTRELLRRMGSPEEKFKIIHVAGTNGKGSVCSYLNAMLMEGGYRCGMFTSPHLVKINERFMINNRKVSDELFLEAFTELKKIIDQFIVQKEAHPTYFEMLFLMGMYIFDKEDVEYVILETGMGGRLDATNTVKRPLACVITSISKDHMEYLGDTIPKIAAEKAGIIKPHVPVIYDGHKREAACVIAARAKELKSPAYELVSSMYTVKKQGRDGITFEFSFEKEKVTLQIPYIAKYQMMNASLAYLTMKKLENVHHISRENLIHGIAKSRWPGRMETVLPGVIIDGAHNEDGIAEFVKTVNDFKSEGEVTLLFSAVRDKRYQSMIREIVEGIHPQHVVTTQISGNRIVSAKELATVFAELGCQDVSACSNVGAAFETANHKRKGGMLFCVGSLYLVGEVKDYLNNRNR